MRPAERIPGSLGALCRARVRKPVNETREWRMRVWRAQQGGYPPHQCGMAARFRVGGTPLCQNHAGQCALSQLLGEKFEIVH